MNEEAKEKNSRKLSYLLPLLVVVFYTLWQMFASGGHTVTAEVDDTQIGLAVDRYESVFIPLEEVREVRLIESLGEWTSLDGSSDRNFSYGRCSIEEYGEAMLSVYTQKPPFLLIRTENDTYIYNHSNQKETTKDYNAITEALSGIA